MEVGGGSVAERGNSICEGARAGQNLTRSRNRKKVLGWCEMDGAAVREWIREEAGGRSCRARE